MPFPRSVSVVDGGTTTTSSIAHGSASLRVVNVNTYGAAKGSPDETAVTASSIITRYVRLASNSADGVNRNDEAFMIGLFGAGATACVTAHGFRPVPTHFSTTIALDGMFTGTLKCACTTAFTHV